MNDDNSFLRRGPGLGSTTDGEPVAVPGVLLATGIGSVGWLALLLTWLTF